MPQSPMQRVVALPTRDGPLRALAVQIWHPTEKRWGPICSVAANCFLDQVWISGHGCQDVIRFQKQDLTGRVAFCAPPCIHPTYRPVWSTSCRMHLVSWNTSTACQTHPRLDGAMSAGWEREFGWIRVSIRHFRK